MLRVTIRARLVRKRLPPCAARSVNRNVRLQNGPLRRFAFPRALPASRSSRPARPAHTICGRLVCMSCVYRPRSRSSQNSDSLPQNHAEGRPALNQHDLVPLGPWSIPRPRVGRKRAQWIAAFGIIHSPQICRPRASVRERVLDHLPDTIPVHPPAQLVHGPAHDRPHVGHRGGAHLLDDRVQPLGQVLVAQPVRQIRL